MTAVYDWALLVIVILTFIPLTCIALGISILQAIEWKLTNTNAPPETCTD